MLGIAFDVHGNLPALEAVLADASAAGVERWILGGDYALFGGWPAETVAALDALDAPVRIRGNAERWTADPASVPENPVVPGGVAACREALGAATVARLAGLAFDAALDGTQVVHASPVSDLRSFLPAPGPEDEELLRAARPDARRLLFGHTHLPFARSAGGVALVNPGSVGMPLDGDVRAAWALLHEDGRIEHRRVAYDHVAAAAQVRARFGPGGWAAIVARRIERAAIDG
jgi:predicted phosphodiesterase